MTAAGPAHVGHPLASPSMNKLYFGDNLNVLREHLASESVDLVYLDPPFNSDANYNILFKSPKGQESHAQIEAFEDTWHWSAQAETEFAEVLHGPNTDVAGLLTAMRSFLGENDLMAYLTMMATRLIELHRVLKNTGSIYLHCDPTASHYLKLLLDAVFGQENYRNEIIWPRTNSHNTAKRYGRVHDVLFFYSKTSSYTWNNKFSPYSDEQLKRYKVDAEGRLYTCQDLTASRPNSDSGKFEWRGTTPSSGRGWGYTLDQLESWWSEGKIAAKKDGTPRMDGLIVYLDEMRGKPIQSVWSDINRISNTSSERLGYPTQKPLALLERLIEVSSNEGDIVLDPFCGCGTAVHAAEKLRRQWVGIDITHLAISLIEKRLRDAFPGIKFTVEGTPKDIDGARDLAERDKYQFQWWACSLVNAQPWGGKKKGADGGIDGLIYFQDDKGAPKKIIVSVKGGDNVGRTMVADLKNAVERDKAAMGLFVTLATPTAPMKKEAVSAGFYETPSGKSFPKIQILTIEGLLSGHERAVYPDLARGALTFKQAQVVSKEEQKGLF